MTTTKPTDPKFEQITVTLVTNIKPRPVTAKTIPGCGLAYHDRIKPTADDKPSKYPITVTHLPSGMMIEHFRKAKHAEAFIREMLKVANFNVPKEELFKVFKAYEHAQMRDVYRQIDSGEYFRKAKP